MTAELNFSFSKPETRRLTNTTYRLMFWSFLGLIAFLGMAQALPRLDRGLIKDEAYTAYMSTLTLPEMIEAFREDTAVPVHYLLVKGWAALFGYSEVSLRLSSVVVFGLTIFIVGVIGYQLGGRAVGIAAAGLLATSTSFGLEQAAIARPYILLSFQTALAGWLCLYLMGIITPRRGKTINQRFLAALLVLVTLSGMLNQPIFVFFVFGYVLAGLVISRRVFVLMFIIAAVSGILYLLIWGSILLETIGHPALAWMDMPNLNSLAAALSMWGMFKSGVLFALILGAAIWRFRTARPMLADKFVLTYGVIISAGILVPFLISPIKLIFNETRTPFIILPAMCLLVGYLLARLTHKWVILGVLLAFGTISGTAAVLAINQSSSSLRSMKYVAENVTCDDTLLLGDLSYLVVKYYFQRYSVPDCVHYEPFPLSTGVHPGWIDPPSVLAERDLVVVEAETTLDRLAQQPSKQIWLFHRKETDRTFELTDIMRAALDARYRLLDEIKLEGQGFDRILIYTTDA